jgi:Ca2+/Na+ antiporter
MNRVIGKLMNKWTLFTFINPGFWLGLGFTYISGSVRLEEWAKNTNFGFLSLYGFFSYENALQFSVFLHGNLDKYSLIPFLFLLSMIVLFVKYYKKSNIEHNKSKTNEALQLTLLEGLFIAVALLVVAYWIWHI